LQAIDTEETAVEDTGVRFIVRSVSSLTRKREEGAAGPPQSNGGRNPFLPPDPALVVGGISPTHLATLNKYPVVEHHLLMVRRQFVPQEHLLDADDCAAIAWCLAEIDGVAFYNGGKAAGASQPHKHLQLVPLPLGTGVWDVPMEALFDKWSAAGGVLKLLQLPFGNAFALLESKLFDDPARAAERIHDFYVAQMLAIGAMAEDTAANDPQQMKAYNLLLTRRWMLAVPRSQERFGGISISALGFAGSLFVRTGDDMQRLREVGPMSALRQVVE
jgi:ATP adenylyltransferase